jgi:hypothetical protein
MKSFSQSKERIMKRVRVGVLAATVLAVAALAYAQKPDFSGAWTLDRDASQMRGGGAPGGGGGGGGRMGAMMGPMTVKQTGDTLVIERQMGDNKMTMTYKLDGTESTNTMMSRGGQVEAKSTAKWDGNKLVISTKRDMGGQTVETVETWSLADGVLTIDSTGGRGPSKRVYKKTT